MRMSRGNRGGGGGGLVDGEMGHAILILCIHLVRRKPFSFSPVVSKKRCIQTYEEKFGFLD